MSVSDGNSQYHAHHVSAESSHHSRVTALDLQDQRVPAGARRIRLRNTLCKVSRCRLWRHQRLSSAGSAGHTALQSGHGVHRRRVLRDLAMECRSGLEHAIFNADREKRMRNTSRIKRDIVYARVLEVMHAVDGIKRGATDIGARTSRLLSLVCQATEPSSPSVLPTRPEGNEASAAMPEPFGLPRPQDHPQNTELELNAFMQTHLITQDLEFWSTWFET